jgi:hypothetical protein
LQPPQQEELVVFPILEVAWQLQQQQVVLMMRRRRRM